MGIVNTFLIKKQFNLSKRDLDPKIWHTKSCNLSRCPIVPEALQDFKKTK